MRVTLALLFAGSLLLGGCRGEKQGADKPDANARQGSNATESKPQGQAATGGQAASAGQASDSPAEQKAGSVAAGTVQIPREDQQRAGIAVIAVTVRSLPRALTVNGEVTMDERHTNHIGVLADGRIVAVSVLPGDPVHRGQTLATLHSHSVHETVEELVQAFDALRRQSTAVSYATQKRDRYVSLYSIRAASLQEKQEAEQELAEAQKSRDDAQAMVVGEREHLAELLQVAPESLNANNLYQREMVPVRAVADGVVVSRSLTPGQVMHTGDEAFVTTNLTTVWVNAAVNEKDLPEVRTGAGVSVALQGGGGRTRRGQVARSGEMLDPQTRTLPVRIVVPNPGLTLRPHMFVTASIEEAGTRPAILVPADALQDVNGFRVVFVTPDGLNFMARAVKTGAESGGLTEVTEGLQPTDHVVAAGAFMVKGALLKGSVGED